MDERDREGKIKEYKRKRKKEMKRRIKRGMKRMEDVKYQ